MNTNQATTPAVFQFHSTEIRTVDRGGQIWFVAGDVAKALNYADAVQRIWGLWPDFAVQFRSTDFVFGRVRAGMGMHKNSIILIGCHISR